MAVRLAALGMFTSRPTARRRRSGGCASYLFLYPNQAREETSMKRSGKPSRGIVYAGLMVMALVFTGSAAAQDVSPADKEKALQYLESTKKGVLDATRGLSDAQWNFKPAPDRWSLAELIEHLAAAEDMLRGVTENQIM